MSLAILLVGSIDTHALTSLSDSIQIAIRT